MEVRKLIKMGKSSSVVSLPKKWIDNTKLKPGSNVYIDETTNNELILSPASFGKEIREINLDIKNGIKKDYLRRLLLGKYLSGYERINIVSKDLLASETREEIERIANSVIGLEVVEEGLKRVSLECLVKPGELPIDKILRRMYLLTKDMYKDSIEIAFQKEKAMAKTVIERDLIINRLYLLSMRYLYLAATPGASTDIAVSSKDCLFYQSVSKRIEGIADHTKNIAKYLSRIGTKRIPKKFLLKVKDVNTKINDLFDSVMKAFFKNDVEAANQIIDKQKNIRDNLKELVPEILRVRSSATLDLALALDSSLRIVDYTSDIAEVTIDRAA